MVLNIWNNKAVSHISSLTSEILPFNKWLPKLPRKIHKAPEMPTVIRKPFVFIIIYLEINKIANIIKSK